MFESRKNKEFLLSDAKPQLKNRTASPVSDKGGQTIQIICKISAESL
jgi:hypothetical protein